MQRGQSRVLCTQAPTAVTAGRTRSMPQWDTKTRLVHKSTPNVMHAFQLAVVALMVALIDADTSNRLRNSSSSSKPIRRFKRTFFVVVKQQPIIVPFVLGATTIGGGFFGQVGGKVGAPTEQQPQVTTAAGSGSGEPTASLAPEPTTLPAETSRRKRLRNNKKTTNGGRGKNWRTSPVAEKEDDDDYDSFEADFATTTTTRRPRRRHRVRNHRTSTTRRGFDDYEIEIQDDDRDFKTLPPNEDDDNAITPRSWPLVQGQDGGGNINVLRTPSPLSWRGRTQNRISSRRERADCMRHGRRVLCPVE